MTEFDTFPTALPQGLSWEDLANWSSEDVCRIVDRAVIEALPEVGDISRSEFYLFTEGAAYAMLARLREAGYVIRKPDHLRAVD